MQWQDFLQKGRSFLFYGIAIFGWFVFLYLGFYLLLAALAFQFIKWFLLDTFFQGYYQLLGATVGGQLLGLWHWLQRRIPRLLDFVGLPPVPPELAMLNPNNLPCTVVRGAYLLARPNLFTFCLGLGFAVYWSYIKAQHYYLTQISPVLDCVFTDCD